MGSCLVHADHDLMRDATLSATNEDAAYPVTRLQTDDLDSPGKPFKATTTATTITITLDTPISPAGLAIINHNLQNATVVLRNGVGFEETIPIPNDTRGGMCVNVWIDLRDFEDRNDADWEIEITDAAANVAIGRIVLASALQELLLEPGLKLRPDRLTSPPLRTTYGHELRYNKSIRQRLATLALRTETDQAVIEAAHEAAHGMYLPWLFLPDVDVNDAWWVKFESLEWTLLTPDQMPAAVAVREVSMGLHL